MEANVILALMQCLGGKVEVYVDNKKVTELDDDAVWETMPKLAQERSKGKEVKMVQVLDDGTKIDMGAGDTMEKLMAIVMPADDRRRLESEPSGNTLATDKSIKIVKKS